MTQADGTILLASANPSARTNAASPSPRRASVVRWVCLATSIAILGFAVAVIVGNVALIRALGGDDFGIYLRHTREWLSGGSFYDARQLTGSPYTLVVGDSLYPPPFAIVMLPFLILPGLMWWVLPAIIVGAVIRQHRPAPWTWPILAICIAYPRTLDLLVRGNPSMLLSASVALATLCGRPGIFAFLKPSLAFLALIGIRNRAWWIAMSLLALVSLAMLADWREYLTAATNLQGQDLTYSLRDIPLAGIAIVAWVGRTRGRTIGPGDRAHRAARFGT
jgi:hypothetical protein